MFKLSQYIAKTELENGFTLVYSTRTSQLLRIKSLIFGLIEKKELENINSHSLLELFNNEILVLEKENEFATIINSFVTVMEISSDVFSYTIQPSANCQLGCEYCGQVHEKINLTNDQSDQIFEYLKNQLEKYNYKRVDITWYGAEPLLGLNGMRYLSQKLINYTELRDMQYTASIITNGLAMKESVFMELAKMRITQFQITLDGTKSLHDGSRFMKSKKGKTYDRILTNIKNAVNNSNYEEYKCNILIRCNVSKKNYLDINNLIESIYRLGLHEKISMQFEPIHDWGKNEAHQEFGLSSETFAEIEIDYLIKLRQLGFKRNLPLLPQRKFSTCMITDKNSEIIDAKGRIAYCWEVPYTPEFDYENSPFIIGQINSEFSKKNRQELPLGNWYEDIKNSRYNTWCKNCNFLPVCGGSCPINWYKGNPACPSFKYNIEDRLSLQYLDDIMYNFTND